MPLNEKLLPTMSKLERVMIRFALRDHHANLDDAARPRPRHLAQGPVPETPAPRFVTFTASRNPDSPIDSKCARDEFAS